jgi:hypothetical protein
MVVWDNTGTSACEFGAVSGEDRERAEALRPAFTELADLSANALSRGIEPARRPQPAVVLITDSSLRWTKMRWSVSVR